MIVNLQLCIDDNKAGKKGRRCANAAANSKNKHENNHTTLRDVSFGDDTSTHDSASESSTMSASSKRSLASTTNPSLPPAKRLSAAASKQKKQAQTQRTLQSMVKANATSSADPFARPVPPCWHFMFPPQDRSIARMKWDDVVVRLAQWIELHNGWTTDEENKEDTRSAVLLDRVPDVRIAMQLEEQNTVASWMSVMRAVFESFFGNC